jgi:hypothetical protein
MGSVWVKYLHHLKEYNVAYMMGVKYTKIIKLFMRYGLKLSAVVAVEMSMYICTCVF